MALVWPRHSCFKLHVKWQMDRGQTIQKSIGGAEAEVFYTTAWYQSYPPHRAVSLRSAVSTDGVHWRCPVIRGLVAQPCLALGALPTFTQTALRWQLGSIQDSFALQKSDCNLDVFFLSFERTNVELFPLSVFANYEQCIWLICVTWVFPSELVNVFSKSDGDLVGVPNPLALLLASETGNL